MRTILMLAVFAAGPALAQAPAVTASPAAAPQPQAEPAAFPPTLSITARIEAKSIRIQQRGDTEVSIWAEPGGKGEWKLDRHGLPDPIPVGKTFNNVALDLDAHATIDDRGVSLGATAAPGEAAPPEAPAPTSPQ